MKELLTIIGILLGVVILLLVILRIVGLDPGTTGPGMWLTGELVTEPISDWTFAAKERNFAVQTGQWFLPILAHSVTATRWHYNGKLSVIYHTRPGSRTGALRTN
jgi:hypothetical protein